MFWSRRKQREQDLERELRSHLGLEAEELAARGLSADEARHAAIRALGNVGQIQEATRESWGWMALDRLMQDVRYALRTMRQNKAFTATAILTLALGIGANTAIFTVVRAVLLKPLDYRDPGRLVLLSGSATPAHYDQLRKGRSFSDVGAYSGNTEKLTLSGAEGPEVLDAARVSANFLRILGVQPILGRTFLAAEDMPGAPPVVLLSSRLWKRRFNSDAGVAGRTVTIDATKFTVIGVLPENFQFPFPDLDAWVTKPDEQSGLAPKSRMLSPLLSVLARLDRGVDIQQASAELNLLNRQYAAAFPTRLDAKPNVVATAKPLRENLVADVRAKLWMLFGAVGFVLLIACANVAGLFLARAGSRAREFAVRVAIGAGRARLIRQLLTESILLALIGGVIGVAVARWSLTGIAALTSISLPRASEIHLDGWVLLFSIALSVTTGILFGLLPSLIASRANPASVLRGSTQNSSSQWWNPRGLLVIVQVGLSMVLLIGAILLMESVAHLNSVSPGFRADNLLTMRVALPPARYDTDQKKTAFFEALVRGIDGLPQVENAAVSLTLPMGGWAGTPVQVEEQPPLRFNERPIAVVQTITKNYFRVMKVAFARGREFTDHDLADSQPVVIVNEALARRFWPEYPKGLDPVGQHLFIGINPKPSEIVGIVMDLRESGLDADPRPGVYIPLSQRSPQTAMVAIRTTPGGDPLRIVNSVRRQVAAIDPDQAISGTKTMEGIVEDSIGQRRFLMTLLSIFAGAAVLLAIVGIYGVIAYSVVQRTKEIAIRRALGAQRANILSLMLGQALVLALVGVAMGIGCAFALTRVMASLLFHVNAADPLTFAGVALLFVAVALGAGFIPARRAAKIDPMTALRVG